jgi:hypothetical protein
MPTAAEKRTVTEVHAPSFNRIMPGPAHAVYFATYEAVKHAMGGNKAGEHHPLAAGKPLFMAGARSSLTVVE